jgi:hypothetical protein
MEVHPPHAPLHTWKDFWIHLGTITIGLLIAISLEQSVEALHHHHQRLELEADLRTEGHRNEEILARDIKLLGVKRAGFIALRHNVDLLRKARMNHARDPQLPPLPQPNSEDVFLPSVGVWTSARDSSQLTLLPRELTEVYEELYFQDTFSVDNINRWFAAIQDVSNFQNQFRDSPADGTLDIMALDVGQLDQYSALLTRLISVTDDEVNYVRFFQTENKIVLSGVNSTDELHRKMAAQR